MGITQWAKSHALRISVEVANTVLNHDAVFRLVGAVNRRTGVIESVFLVYPATEKYALAYAYPRRIEKIRWTPWPSGILWQDGRLTLMVGVSATDQHYQDLQNHKSLVQLVERVEDLRQRTGARQKTFAGILPGVLASRGILTDPPEGDITAAVVAQAVRALHREYSEPPPVVILGGRGFIGRRLVDLLERDMDIHPVDTADPAASWPDNITGRQALLVNVAGRHALAEHLDRLWPGLTIINEVYPEPSPALLEQLQARGIDVHHIVGVKARAFPPFPAAYAGAIPCCAAWPSPGAQVVTRLLTEGSLRQG